MDVLEVEVRFLHDNSHTVGRLIGQLNKIVGHISCKGGERVMLAILPNEIDVIGRLWFQVGISPYLAIGRCIEDIAHSAPISREHIL